MRVSLSLVATLLAACVAAQTESPGYGAPATLNDSAIALLGQDTRESICNAQQDTCSQLCSPQGAYPNSCNTTTLEWGCVCKSDMKTPDLAAYVQSVPAQLCQDYVNACVQGNTTGSNSAYLQKECLAIPCGKKVVSVATGSVTSAASTPTKAPTSTTPASAAGGSTTATSASAAASSTGAAVVLQFGQNYGTGALAVGVLAMFGLAI